MKKCIFKFYPLLLNLSSADTSFKPNCKTTWILSCSRFLSIMVFILAVINTDLYGQYLKNNDNSDLDFKEKLCATNNSNIIYNNNTFNATSYTIKVLLVEFSDIKHDPRYTQDDWINMLFSERTYFTPNMTSPDGENVYGSMRDYYSIMSDGEFELTGYILNPDSNADGEPDWLTLPHIKNYYNENSDTDFKNDYQFLAAMSGFNISTNSTTVLCVIYAGNIYRHGLLPRASGTEYIMSEKYAAGAPYNIERMDDATFAGIGIHCHEFGHLLGWKDTYNNSHNNTFWTLMAYGYLNKNTHAPAPLCPEFRIQKGWITPVEIKENSTFYADYNLKDPEVFKICFNDDPERYFLIENRSFNSKMNYNGILIDDYNNFLPWNWINNPHNLPNQGLLVWAHKKKRLNPLDPNWSYLIQADGENNAANKFNTAEDDKDKNYHTGDSGDPFPGYTGNRIFSPWSFPLDLCNGPSPSSYPSSNVGFEIIEMGSDYIKVDFYFNNPEKMRPQTPWNVDTLIFDSHPEITWTESCEIDFNNYEIWKNGQLYRSTSDTFFTDRTERIYNKTASKKKYVEYNIAARDNDGKRSFLSKTLRFVVEDVQNTNQYSDFTENTKMTMDIFQLAVNYPNPFNQETKIAFNLPEESQVSLRIYNIQGKIVTILLDGIRQSGFYNISFNGNTLASGVYFYVLNAKALQSGKKFSQSRRMILAK